MYNLYSFFFSIHSMYNFPCIFYTVVFGHIYRRERFDIIMSFSTFVSNNPKHKNQKESLMEFKSRMVNKITNLYHSLDPSIKKKDHMEIMGHLRTKFLATEPGFGRFSTHFRSIISFLLFIVVMFSSPDGLKMFENDKMVKMRKVPHLMDLLLDTFKGKTVDEHVAQAVQMAVGIQLRKIQFEPFTSLEKLFNLHLPKEDQLNTYMNPRKIDFDDDFSLEDLDQLVLKNYVEGNYRSELRALGPIFTKRFLGRIIIHELSSLQQLQLGASMNYYYVAKFYEVLARAFYQCAPYDVPGVMDDIATFLSEPKQLDRVIGFVLGVLQRGRRLRRIQQLGPSLTLLS